jgi:hypothetical protein
VKEKPLEEITIKYMKNLLFLIIAFSLISCREQENTFEVTRIIKNDTDYSLQISVYGSGLIYEQVKIGENSADTANSLCVVERSRLASCKVDWSFVADSVQVIFDDQKELIYCSTSMGCNINDKNIVSLDVLLPNVGGYEKIAENSYVFTLTEEDYEAAELIKQ